MKLAVKLKGTIGLTFLLLLGSCANSDGAIPTQTRQVDVRADGHGVSGVPGELEPTRQDPFAELGPPGEGDLIVNVNTATREEIETIPEIGPELAKRIISGRPYESVDDLIQVKGIGPYTLGVIRPYVKVKGKTERRNPDDS